MEFKKLKTDAELESYRHATHKRIDVLLPLEYLKQGDIFGLYNTNGTLCGGFAIINSGPLRVLNSIPDFSGIELDPELKHTAEITGVWLGRGAHGTFSSLLFWLNIMKAVLFSKKKYFVYAYSLKKTNLEKIYSRANPMVLFRGETTMLPGMDSPELESVELIIKSQILPQAFKNLDFFTSRMRLSKRSVQTAKPSMVSELNLEILPAMPLNSKMISDEAGYN